MSKYSRLLFSLFSISTAAVVADDVEVADNCSPPRPACEQPCVVPKPCEPRPVCPPKPPKCKVPCPNTCGEPQGVTTEPQYVITPPFGPRVDNGADFYVSADFLWWKTNIGGMEYAIQGVNDSQMTNNFVPFGQSTKKGHIAQTDCNFQPGFKLGAGLVFEHDGWDIFAEWTWLSNENTHTHTKAKAGLGLATALPLWCIVGTIPSPNPAILFLNEASSKWKHHFNVLDFEMGRKFFISKRLTLRPHFGLKTAWIREKLKFNFEPVNSVQQADEIFIAAEQVRKQHLWGIGIRGGLDTVWHFNKHWGVYGDIALTGLWSDFHCSFKDQTTSITVVITDNLKARETITEVIPVLELGLGLTWMTWFNCDSYMLQISAGWEEQMWLNYNRFVDIGRYGSLSTQGLTIKAEFAF